MQKIEIINQNTLVLDDDRKILPGAKIDFLDPVSLNPVNVYTYDSSTDEYIAAVNPIYLDVNSRPEQTYFVDQLTYCRLYKYIGNFSDPMLDDDTDDWSFVRDWYGAYSEEALDKNDIQVTGITALKTADTSLGNIQVIGYWNDHDCEPRTYVWVEGCAVEEDGGYIIKSSISDTGRWILKFDGEYIPSTYYGVYPGKETNMQSLLSYVAKVNDITTAPGIYFIKGDYTANTQALYTAKKVLLDADTTFACSSFTVADVRVIGKATKAICDFKYTSQHGTMKLSWFKSIKGFFYSNPDTYDFDADNLLDKTMTTSPLLETVKFIGQCHVSDITFSDCYIAISNATICATGIFDANWHIQFRNMKEWPKTAFNNESNLTFGTDAKTDNIVFTDTWFDKTNALEFQSAVAYTRYAIANGDTELDYMGRCDLSSFTYPTTVTTLKNGTATDKTITFTAAETVLENMKLTNAVYFTNSLTKLTLTDSSIETNGTNITTLVATNSEINQLTNTSGCKIDLKDCAVTLDACTTDILYEGPISEQAYSDTKYAKAHLLVAKNTHFKNAINTNYITLEACVCDMALTLYPCIENGSYWLYTTFKNCSFAQDITYKWIDWTWDASQVYNIIPQISIIGCSFSGTYGIIMPYYSVAHELNPDTGLFVDKYFIKANATNGASVTYNDNIGSCPAEEYEKNTVCTDYDTTVKSIWKMRNTGARVWDLGFWSPTTTLQGNAYVRKIPSLMCYRSSDKIYSYGHDLKDCYSMFSIQEDEALGTTGTEGAVIPGTGTGDMFLRHLAFYDDPDSTNGTPTDDDIISIIY